jgi:hypothetical protein
MFQMEVDNVTCQNFGAGNTSTGFYFVNQVNHTEQMHGRIYSSFNCQGVVFNVDGGDTSFDRMALDIFLDHGQVAGGYAAGVQFEGGAVTDDVVHLGIWGNFSYGTSADAPILVLGTDSLIQGNLDMGIELGGTVSSYVPQTIYLNSGARIDATGRLSFGNGDTFTPAYWQPGQFAFSGPISGDVQLMSRSVYGSGGTTLTANGQTIPLLGSVMRLGGSAAYTGLILGVGTSDGMVLDILNQVGYAQTFAASGTSNVASGTSPAIPVNAGMRLVWDASESLWYVTGTG